MLAEETGRSLEPEKACRPFAVCNQALPEEDGVERSCFLAWTRCIAHSLPAQRARWPFFVKLRRLTKLAQAFPADQKVADLPCRCA